uniref:non-specific serine/threonine protein kinase n=1 Tax=Rhizophagus irregularis (strain DAOM 181602 / DAOM 197198 / MUCL 43194) TaxID=747089 RepID=U9T2I4_RHIID
MSYDIQDDDIKCKICGEIYTDLYYKWCKPCQIINIIRNFANWTSGNEKIDKFIQEMQLKVEEYNKIIFEWIPYNQFNYIKKISKGQFTTAIWKDGSLEYNHKERKYKRNPNEEVTLKYLNNSQNIINDFLNEVETQIIKRLKYTNISKIYGISQNPDTKNYIIVFQDGCYCDNCNEIYTNISFKWCKLCQINDIKQNFSSQTIGNKIIDDFIQEMQLAIESQDDVVFEWIPYNKFNNVKEIRKDTIYSAIWKDGSLKYNNIKRKYERSHDEKVTLKCFNNSQNIINSFLKELKVYIVEGNLLHFPIIYGISQNPNTENYIIVFQDGCCCNNCGEIYTKMRCKSCEKSNIKQHLANWTSGNEKIDEFIQEMQLDIERNDDRIIEWIPYNKFNNIKRIGKGNFATVIWNDGPLKYNYSESKYKRESNKKVILKCLNYSQNITSEFLNEVKEINKTNTMYGISQNPDTEDYIIVLDNNNCEECGEIYTDISFQWCKQCQINDIKNNFTNWSSGNKKIDGFIQEMQLKVERHFDIIVEWIPYRQFNNIKKIGKGEISIAIWKNGPLEYDYRERIYERKSNKEVTLKYLNESQNVISDSSNKVKVYSIKENEYDIPKIYGISQNPDTKDYIVVLDNSYCKECGDQYIGSIYYKWCKPCQINNLKNNFTNWSSGNERIDEFIRKMQLTIEKYDDKIVEWIPYNQFNISKICNSSFATAIWKDGLLKYNYKKKKLERIPNKEVTLKCLNNSQNNTNKLLNKVKIYSIKGNKYDTPKLYGISQNPDTKDYIIVLDNRYCKECGEIYTKISFQWCKQCQINDFKKNFTNWSSENEKIDGLIQEMQLKIKSCSEIIVEWIPYNQFSNIKEIGKGGFATVYLAIWKDGPLEYIKNKKEWERSPNKKVALKCPCNLQNITDGFLKEIEAYSIDKLDGILRIHGISQNPDTKDYIIVLEYANCGNLNYFYSNIIRNYRWYEKLSLLRDIIKGLKKIHENGIVHHDFHTGNILISLTHNKEYFSEHPISNVYISDMGLCREADNAIETKIYGVMPYMAPEVLRGKPYTQAADIYSFGMIMYFVATGQQPFADCAHDNVLAFNICKGIRPEINKLEIPESYINLMERCWSPNPDNRPNAIEIKDFIQLFYNDEEVKKQVKEVEKYKEPDFLSDINNQTIHPQAYYASRLLNPFTKDLSKDDTDTECLDCVITN